MPTISTATFAVGEGLTDISPVLVNFLVTYAQSKGLPIYNNSSLLNASNANREIAWVVGTRSNRQEFQVSTPTTQITVQSFMSKCDNYAEAQKLSTTKTVTLGDYGDVLLDGAAKNMRIRRENVSFDTIRRAHALSLDVPKGGAAAVTTFLNAEGITGTPELIEFLANYAKEKGVPFATDQDYALYNRAGEFRGKKRMRWHQTSTVSLHGFIDHAYETELTAQQFLAKADAYAESAKYTFKLTGTEFEVQVNHDTQIVHVGCQRISFPRLAELVGEIYVLEAAAEAVAAKAGK